jgi:radical SAM protein with 4Fe4S-binding SPASM domain
MESGLNRLIISIDGAGQQSYEAYRQGGDFDKVATGIRLLVSERTRLKRQNPEIVLQCLLLKSTEQHLAEIRKFGNELGVDKIIFKTAQFNDYKNGNPLMPETEKYSRYKKIAETKMQNAKCKMQNTKLPGHPAETSDPDKINQHINTLTHQHINTLPHQHINPLSDSPVYQFTGLPVHRYIPKNRMPNACFRMWSSCVITWDGKVVPCCFDKDATHVMGDLTTQDFTEIWRSPQYHGFRQTILRKRKSTAICMNCTQTF